MIRASRVLVGIMMAQCRRRCPIITSTLDYSVSCYLGSGLFGIGVRKRHKHCYVTVPQQTRNNHPMLFQYWASVEGCSSTLKQDSVNGMCLLMCWYKVYSRPGVKLILGQHRRRLTVIERTMGCNAGPTLSRNWVGRPTSCVRV